MKVIYEHDLGTDGGKAGAYLDEGMLEIAVKYPVAKVLDPVFAALDPVKQKIKDLIPGDVGNDAIDKLFEEAKAEVAKLLAE